MEGQCCEQYVHIRGPVRTNTKSVSHARVINFPSSSSSFPPSNSEREREREKEDPIYPSIPCKGRQQQQQQPKNQRSRVSWRNEGERERERAIYSDYVRHNSCRSDTYSSQTNQRRSPFSPLPAPLFPVFPFSREIEIEGFILKWNMSVDLGTVETKEHFTTWNRYRFMITKINFRNKKCTFS